MTDRPDAITRAKGIVEELDKPWISVGFGATVFSTNLTRALFSNPDKTVEALARVLWDRERIRSEHAGSIISSTGLAIEPFEDCADTTWRPDARAILTRIAEMGREG